MFSDCSMVEGTRLELLGWPFGVPFCFSAAAAAACLRVRTLGEPLILGVPLVSECRVRYWRRFWGDKGVALGICGGERAGTRSSSGPPRMRLVIFGFDDL